MLIFEKKKNINNNVNLKKPLEINYFLHAFIFLSVVATNFWEKKLF